jgi:GNAT superfamily N-acetyltransferase
LKIRKIDLNKDRQTLLDFHYVTNYESGSPILHKAYTPEQYREIWMKSHGPEEFLSTLAKSIKDPQTIAEFWENEGSVVAYIWVTFMDWPEFKAIGAEISDILVVPEFQRRGIATQIIKHVEELARKRGATLLRSGTGIKDVASQELHAKMGFQTYRVEFEKEL